MPIDPLSLAVGAVVALVPLLAALWSLQRRLTREQGEQALRHERPDQRQLSQTGLQGQLDACLPEMAEARGNK
ncbi:MAG: DNA recombination protein RmuC, partial [Pseudomonas sp.]|nr:DNA recombination protein RmuC [Pseudomonas sp.]